MLPTCCACTESHIFAYPSSTQSCTSFYAVTVGSSPSSQNQPATHMHVLKLLNVVTGSASEVALMQEFDPLQVCHQSALRLAETAKLLAWASQAAGCPASSKRCPARGDFKTSGLGEPGGRRQAVWQRILHAWQQASTCNTFHTLQAGHTLLAAKCRQKDSFVVQTRNTSLQAHHSS